MNALRNVLISVGDNARILSALDKIEPEAAGLLREELDAATILTDEELPSNVVNMGAEVRFRDLESGEYSRCTLVFPLQANVTENRVSVLAPVGAALIGLAEGDTIEWPVPGGKLRRLQVVAVEQNRHHAVQA